MTVDAHLKFDPVELKRIYTKLANQERRKFRKIELKYGFAVLIGLGLLIMPLVVDYLVFIGIAGGSFFAILCIVPLSIYRRWKFNRLMKQEMTRVEDWIALKSKVGGYRLLVDENCLSIYEDEDLTEYAWDELNEASVNEDFIWINHSTTGDLILPRRLLSETDFQVISNYVKEKVLKDKTP